MNIILAPNNQRNMVNSVLKLARLIALISQLSSRSLSFSWLVSLVRVKVESFVNWLVLVGM